jgi:hypothetical protein
VVIPQNGPPLSSPNEPDRDDGDNHVTTPPCLVDNAFIPDGPPYASSVEAGTRPTYTLHPACVSSLTRAAASCGEREPVIVDDPFIAMTGTVNGRTLRRCAVSSRGPPKWSQEQPLKRQSWPPTSRWMNAA